MWLLLILIAILLFVRFSLRYAWWRPTLDESCPRILMYHMIAAHRKDARFNGLRVPLQQFELQLGWLREHGWSSYTVSELIAMQGRVPNKTVVITFDDGYADNLLAALPLLEKYDFRATLYLVVERFDRDWSVSRKAHHNEGELMREAKLSDEQVSLLLQSGRFELGSHGMTHANFQRCDEAMVKYELNTSRQLLEEKFAVPVESFAYPFGLFQPQHVTLVEEAGYCNAVTTEQGVADMTPEQRFTLRRIKVGGRENMRAFRLCIRTGRRGLFK